jgi:hypothetical protein
MGESETKKVHEIDGYLVETDSGVRLLTGPVVGEVGLSAPALFSQTTFIQFQWNSAY